MQKLATDDIQTYLAQAKGWRVEDGYLKKEFGFKGFSTAMAFMNSLVPTAEKLDHHPDWSNSYNHVSISLMSHAARGLTKNDFIFAKAADEAAALLQK